MLLLKRGEEGTANRQGEEQSGAAARRTRLEPGGGGGLHGAQVGGDLHRLQPVEDGAPLRQHIHDASQEVFAGSRQALHLLRRGADGQLQRSAARQSRGGGGRVGDEERGVAGGSQPARQHATSPPARPHPTTRTQAQAHRHALPVPQVVGADLGAAVVQGGGKQLLHIGGLVDGMLKTEGLLQRGGGQGRREGGFFH